MRLEINGPLKSVEYTCSGDTDPINTLNTARGLRV